MSLLVRGSEEFEGSVLCPLLFIIVLEALSHYFRSGDPGRTSMPMTLLSSLYRLEECQEALTLERSNGGKRAGS